MRTQAYAGRGCQSFISEVVRQHQSRSNRQKARGNSLECFGCRRADPRNSDGMENGELAFTGT